jgi:hypothetical protein
MYQSIFLGTFVAEGRSGGGGAMVQTWWQLPHSPGSPEHVLLMSDSNGWYFESILSVFLQTPTLSKYEKIWSETRLEWLDRTCSRTGLFLDLYRRPIVRLPMRICRM